MNKKQSLILGAMAVGLSTSSMATSFTETLDRLSVESISAGRVRCPYNLCDVELPNGEVEVRLGAAEEAQIDEDLKALNSLDIVTGATLIASIAKPVPSCYNQICPDKKEELRTERRVRAHRLAELVDAGTRSKD